MRYQIITYDNECGADEKKDYNTIKEAIQEAKKLLKDYESIFIYDRQKKAVRHAFNGIVPSNIFSSNIDISHPIYHF